MAKSFSLVTGGVADSRSRPVEVPSLQKEDERIRPFPAAGSFPPFEASPLSLPSALAEREKPTLGEVFAAHPRDGGWIGFLFGKINSNEPLLWIQDRMVIVESGRIHPPALPTSNLIHVEARDARDVLWAMEEGLRCSSLFAVIGEIWGDPKALDFTATRRLAVASERSGVAAFLIRLGGHANLSGARMRWRIASTPSLINHLDPRAPGAATWDAELFRARGTSPGRWNIAHEAGSFHLLSKSRDRALVENQRLSA